jgi:hypothetical protein
MALRIAPRGWDHSSWVGSFYPDDLPADWRLAFFCNEFDALLVPENQWRLMAPTEVGAWRADCGPRMRFYLERGSAEEGDMSFVEALGPVFGGFIEAGTGSVGHWSQGAEDLRGLRSTIERLAAGGGEALLIVDGDPPSLPALQAARTIAELLGVAG